MNALPEIADQARNKWASILPMFDIDASHLTGRQRPCPICGGKDRFRFDNKEGRGTWICNSCGAGDGIKLLLAKTGMSFTEVAREVRERLGEAVDGPAPRIVDDAKAKELLRSLYRASAPISDDMAAAYLVARGFSPPWPDALRFCAETPISRHPTRRTLPAMLAIVSDTSGKWINIHRTYLDGPAKAKIDEPRRMMPGTLPAGAAIRLGSYDGRLATAEGIETALAVTRDFGIPCWSVINSTMLAKFIPPADVWELHVFGDNDPKLGGQAAAYQAAHRAAVTANGPGIVEVHIPQRVGTDWAETSARAAA